MPVNRETGMMVAEIEMGSIGIDPDDIVRGLENNDDSVLLFVVQLLEHNDSVSVRDQLAEKLKTWIEDRKDT